MEFKYINSNARISSSCNSRFILVFRRRKIPLSDNFFTPDEMYGNRLIDEKKKNVEDIIYHQNPRIRPQTSTYYIYVQVDSKSRYVSGYGLIYIYKFKPIIEILRNKHEIPSMITEEYMYI